LKQYFTITQKICHNGAYAAALDGLALRALHIFDGAMHAYGSHRGCHRRHVLLRHLKDMLTSISVA